MMQSRLKSELNFRGFAKRIDCERANLPSPAWHLTFAIWFSAVWLPASPVSFPLPVAVRRCNQCVYGGVPTSSLTRIATLSGCMQSAHFMLPSAFTNLAGRFSADTFEAGLQPSDFAMSDTVATDEIGFRVEDRAYSNFGRYLL